MWTRNCLLCRSIGVYPRFLVGSCWSIYSIVYNGLYITFCSYVLFFVCSSSIYGCWSGADPGFQVRGAHLKTLRWAEGGAKMFGIFRVKNHDFTPKNLIIPLDPPLLITPLVSSNLSSLSFLLEDKTPLSKSLTCILSAIKSGLHIYSDTSYSRGSVNQMWILKNCKDLFEYIQYRSPFSCNSIKHSTSLPSTQLFLPLSWSTN